MERITMAVESIYRGILMSIHTGSTGGYGRRSYSTGYFLPVLMLRQ